VLSRELQQQVSPSSTTPPSDVDRSPADARTSVPANAAAATTSIRLAPKRIRAFGCHCAVLVCVVLLQKYDFPVTAAQSPARGQDRGGLLRWRRGRGEGIQIYIIAQNVGKSVFVRLAIYRTLIVATTRNVPTYAVYSI